jgi:hypothetical protein
MSEFLVKLVGWLVVMPFALAGLHGMAWLFSTPRQVEAPCLLLFMAYTFIAFLFF